MKTQYPLFSEVALTEDLKEYNLKRGDTATIVEHYPMPDGEEDGYSLEGFDVPSITIEVAASQIIPISQWQKEKAIMTKLSRLSSVKLQKLEEYLDGLLQTDQDSQDKQNA